jgi:hypothetical protein
MENCVLTNGDLFDKRFFEKTSDLSYNVAGAWNSAFCFAEDPETHVSIPYGTVTIDTSYLDLGASDYSLQHPPKAGEPSDDADVRRISLLASLRSDSYILKIIREQEQPLPGGGLVATRLSVPEIGPASTSKDKTKDLFFKVQRDAFRVVVLLKRKFDRPRPYHRTLLANLTPLFYVGHPSYPSGHATDAFVAYEICKQLWAGKSKYEMLLEKVRNAAEGYALNREIAGVHFQSDTDAGRELSKLIATRLVASTNYLSDLAAARDEWK